ncbi:DNA sulfur modification protein DndB [Sphaerospermopsis sp. FACHB-1094]|nr:DNA sulfur modification protein DndB [Sphaerospermopsis sp. FACHB-1094]
MNEDSNNNLSPEIKAKFSSFVAPFFEENYRDSCYPGLIFYQGMRKMLQINIPARDFPSLLITKPATENDPDSGRQRPEVPGHADEIKNYIIEQAEKGKKWILGTLTANVSQHKIKILEFGRGFCIVVIPRDVKLEITDGQHRKSAIQKLIEGDQSHLISNHDFPITLVLEDDIDQCKKDFGDMAQTKPLNKALLISYRTSEGRVGITKKLVEQVNIFAGRTDKVHDVPRAKLGFIYSNNFILRAVSYAFTNTPDDEMKEYDLESSSIALANCLNQFFSECSNTRKIALKTADTTQSYIKDIKKFKDECLLGVSVGLEVLARLLYCTYDKNSNSFDETKVSQLAQINWLRNNPMWENTLIRINPNSKNPENRYRLTTTINAISDAVNMLKDKLGWSEYPPY